MSVAYGPKLGLMVNANLGDDFGDAFRPFLRFIDALLMGGVLSSSVTVPPTSPNNGDSYLLLGTPTGAWAGHANAIAVYSTQITSPGTNITTPGWEFWSPKEGWRIWDTSQGVMQFYSKGAWAPAASRTKLQVVASASTVTFDFTGSVSQKTVLTQATTINFVNGVAGDRMSLILQQDSVGGHQVTFAANILGVSGTGTSPSSSTVFDFLYDGTNYLLSNSPVENQ